VPSVEWRIHAALGRLLLKPCSLAAAKRAFGGAATVIRKIAGFISDSEARTAFLSTAEVREVNSGAGNARGVGA